MYRLQILKIVRNRIEQQQLLINGDYLQLPSIAMAKVEY